VFLLRSKVINFLGDALRDLLDVREAKDLAHA
jgi:hypothetical protein